MATLKYTVIKNKEQYTDYCNLVEQLLSKPNPTMEDENEIELLTTLIEVWDEKHSTIKQLDPVQLLRSFIKEHKLKPGATMKIMGITSRGHYSEIMNYQKGFSKEVIRKLAGYFKVSQEAFNRPYALKKPQFKATAQPAIPVKRVVKAVANDSISKSRPAKRSKAVKKTTRPASKMKVLQPA